ncbi:MAG: SDR family oxidoreductase [Pseudomonadota bacterium]
MAHSLDFTGKRALVVGGSSGIGNGIAQGFRSAGAEVHIWGTRPAASDYRPEDGGDLAGLAYTQMDVTDPGAVLAFTPSFAELDVLVCCQGTVRYGQEEFERPGWDAVTAVNLDSVMDCARLFRPHLKAAGGSLIIVSSVAGFKASIGNPAYGASKHAAVGLTKTLGAAWASDGIRVNGIAPGLVDTKLTKVTTQNPRRLEGALRAIPQKRLGLPEDMAGAALFLASPLADYICGQTLIVDGGLSLQ